MNKSIWITLLSFAILPAFASADEWKDESGQGKDRDEREWGEHHGEPPAWARGKGYWDGHFKHGRPYADRYQRYWQRRFRPPMWGYPQYDPHPRWRGDWDEDDYEDRWEEWEDRREERREDYEDWLEDRRERMEDLRERRRNAYRNWR